MIFDIKITIWSILTGVLTALLIILLLNRLSKLERTVKKRKYLFNVIFNVSLLTVAIVSGYYFLLVYKPNHNVIGIKFPSTGPVPEPQSIFAALENLFETPADGLITVLLVGLVFYLTKEVIRNINYRKQIEAELDKAKIAEKRVLDDLQVEKDRLAETFAKDEAILDSIADGCIAVNERGEITLINNAAQKLLGYSSEDALGRRWYEILHRADEKGVPISPEFGAISIALSTKTTTTTTTTTTGHESYYYIKKDGIKFPVSRTVSPIKLAGKIIGAVDVFRDITREKEIDRSKSEFVSLASHQLRTPLTGIEWTIELFLKKEKLTKEGKEYLNDISTSATRLSALIKLLLNVSRIESGSVALVPERLDLVALVDECLQENKLIVDKGKISFIFSKHPDKLLMTSDKNLIGYIAQNLISNAINYTPAGGSIEILLEENKGSAIITIRDTGIGIPKEEQPRIFGKFIRASNAVVAKPDGTGLGLYIAHESVNLLGGKIWFESEAGKGTVFFIELPLVLPDQVGEKTIISKSLSL